MSPTSQQENRPLSSAEDNHPAGVQAKSLSPQPAPLSRDMRQRLVARAAYALYRWYVDRSQARRNWNADRSFDWRALKRNHSPQLLSVIEGFYAVEQYAPDYTVELTHLVRHNYGRAQFQMRWGVEEERHADLWRNVLLFSGGRTPRQLEDYTDHLRARAWRPPWNTPLHMLWYTVFQERATEYIYLNTARITRGESKDPDFAGDADPVLAEAVETIARDEAAHFHFYLSLARLHLYYFPEETLYALVEVLRDFVMPAAPIVPNYDAFIKELYSANLFGPRKYGRDVVLPTLRALGIETIKEIEAGLQRTKDTPSIDGRKRPAAAFEGCDFSVLESAVKGLFARFTAYESQTGLSEVDPTQFMPYSWEFELV